MDNVVPLRSQSVEADPGQGIEDETDITISLPCSDIERLQGALINLAAAADLAIAMLSRSHLYTHVETVRGIKQVFKALAHLIGHG